MRKYTIDHLVSDVLAVLKAAGHSKCILVGGWLGDPAMRTLQQLMRSRVLIQNPAQQQAACRLVLTCTSALPSPAGGARLGRLCGMASVGAVP